MLTVLEGVLTISYTLVEPKILEVPVLQLTAACAEILCAFAGGTVLMTGAASLIVLLIDACGWGGW